MLFIDQPLQSHDATERKPGAATVLLTGNAEPAQSVRHGLHQQKDLFYSIIFYIYHHLYQSKNRVGENQQALGN